MRHYPNREDKYDAEDLRRLDPEEWMLDLLKLNPSYCFWGPYEDYMWVEDSKAGWRARIINETWDEFKIELDELNEVVNFYFEVSRESEECHECGGCGTHPDAQWITESFYQTNSPFRNMSFSEQMHQDAFNKRFGSSVGKHSVVSSPEKLYPSEEVLDKYDEKFRSFCEEMRDGIGYWSKNLTSDDLAALEAAGRRYSPTDPFSMDAISQYVVCKARCEKWGIPLTCPDCDGHGYIYEDGVKCKVGLVLWLIHPRKGASRGVHVKQINQDQLPAVYKFLRTARDRNAERFAKIPE